MILYSGEQEIWCGPNHLIACIELVEDCVRAILRKCDNWPCYTVSYDL